MNSDLSIDPIQPFDNIESIKSNRNFKGLFLAGLTGMCVACILFVYINIYIYLYIY